MWHCLGIHLIDCWSHICVNHLILQNMASYDMNGSSTCNFAQKCLEHVMLRGNKHGVSRMSNESPSNAMYKSSVANVLS